MISLRSSTPPPPTVLGQRFGALDALRGLAALTVVFQHALERTSGTYARVGVHQFNLGVFGVTLFFLVSGFVIPISLDRSSGLQRFWINRVTRLYPMLWFSLLLAGLLVALGRYPVPHGFGAEGWLANATMLPGKLHQYPIGPLWTLAYELIFYVGLSLVSLIRLPHRTELLATAVLVLASARAVVGDDPAGRHIGAFWYVTFLAGALLSRVWNGDVERRRGLVMYVAVSVVGLLVLVLTSPDVSSLQSDNPALSAHVTLLSRGAAYLVFTAVVLGLGRSRALPALVIGLGTISYSIYLLHISVMNAVPAVGGAVTATCLWAVITVALSFLTYRYVELPGIRLGHRLSRRHAQGLDPAR